MNIELASAAIPAKESVADDLIDIELTPTTPLETQAKSSQTDNEAPKSKRDSLKRFFERKKHDELHVENSRATDPNLLPTSSSVETFGARKKFYSKIHPKSRKPQGEASVTTVDSEGRKSLKDVFSNYWNSIFNKKAKEDIAGSPGPQNSKSVETEEVVENVEEF